MEENIEGHRYEVGRVRPKYLVAGHPADDFQDGVPELVVLIVLLLLLFLLQFDGINPRW